MRKFGISGAGFLLATTMLSGAVAFVPSQVLAQNANAQRHAFSVPAQPVPQALNAIGRVAGLSVVVNGGGASGVRAQAVSGNLTAREALSAALAGTGLSYSFTNANTVTVFNPSAGAQPQASAADGDAIVLDTIDVSGQRGTLGSHDDTYESAGSVNYVSGEEIASRRGTSVGDFISGIPGVLNGDNRNSGALDVNIRGMQGQGRVPVVIDGASQEQTVYRGYNGARSGSYLDPDLIGEVSIEKGASSGADASGAIGGIVRMRTLSVDDILLPGKQFGVRVRGGLNTNSTTPPDVLTQGGVLGGRFEENATPTTRDGGNMDRPGILEPTGANGSVAAAFSSENVDLVAAFARRKNGNYFSGKHGAGQAKLVDLGVDDYGWRTIGYEGLSPWKGGEEILNTSTDNTSLLLKSNFRFGTDHALELGYMNFDSTFGEIMPTRLGTRTSAVGGYQSPFDELELSSWTARYRWDPESDLINLKVDAFRTDMNHQATNLVTVGNTTTKSLYWMETIRDGITLSNESLIAAVPGDFKLEYGGAWQKETAGLPDGKENDTEFVNMLEFAPRSGNRTELSGFVNADWKINSAWQVKAGLRYADFETTDHNYKMVWDGVSYWPNMSFDLVRDETKYVSADGLSKNISLSWTPTDSLQLYGRYSDAVRMPSIFESLNGFSTGVVPEDLRPERAKTFEFGVNTKFDNVLRADDLLRVHVAYYRNDIDDYLTRSNIIYPEPIGGQIGGLGMINLKNARMSGIELSADYDYGPLSARLSWNHAITSEFCARPGTLHRQDDLCVEGGFVNSYALQHIPPKDTVSLHLGYKMLEDRLTLGTRVSYYSNRFVESKAETTTEIQPGRWKPYTLVDLYGAYKISEAAQIDIAIDNLTDRYYMDALNAALMPAPGRTIRAGITAKF